MYAKYVIFKSKVDIFNIGFFFFFFMNFRKYIICFTLFNVHPIILIKNKYNYYAR